MAEFIGYPVPVAYASGLSVNDPRFTVTYDGSTYAAIADAVPFTTGETFDSSQWRVIEGVIADDLAGSSGASLVGLAQGGVLQAAISYYTPEMFGTVGDGVTDDYATFQSMLDNVPAHGVIWLDPTKTYYNAFSNSEGASRNWIRAKPFTMHCNGALMTRASAVQTTDNQTAVLKLTGAGPFFVNSPRISGANPLGLPWRNDGTQQSSGYEIALCEAIDYGILIESASDVYLCDVEISNCAFNIWIKSSSQIKLSGYLHHSGQVVPNIISGGDLALGAGIKASDCTHLNIDVRGYRCTNATVEIEPNNMHGFVRVHSLENTSNSLVIYDSGFIDFVSFSKAMGGCGVNITRGSSSVDMTNITGTVVSDGHGDSGLRIYLNSNAAGGIEQLHINAQTRNGATYGADIRNYSSTYSIDGLTLHYDGKDNVGTSSGNDLWVYGDVRGRITGRSKGCYNGLICNGVNHQSSALMISMDLSETAVIPYSIGSSFYADLVGTRTASEYKLTSTVPNIRVARVTSGGGTAEYTDLVLRASHFYMLGLPTAGSFTNQLWYDATNNNQVKFKASEG